MDSLQYNIAVVVIMMAMLLKNIVNLLEEIKINDYLILDLDTRKIKIEVILVKELLLLSYMKRIHLLSPPWLSIHSIRLILRQSPRLLLKMVSIFLPHFLVSILSITPSNFSLYIDSVYCNHRISDLSFFSTKYLISYDPTIIIIDGSIMNVSHIKFISTSNLSIS